MAQLVCLWLLMLAPALAAAAPSTRPSTPYLTAHDAPLDAVQEEVERTAGYTKYRVEFNGIKGGRVPGFLYVPGSSGGPKHPAVLLQYGSGGNKSTNYIVAMGQQAVAHGFVVLTIDISGRGERKAERQNRGLFEGNVFETLGDYSRAVDYLVSRPEVDRGKIGYVGISWGAITGITFVAHDPRVRAMASLVGGGNFLGWLKVGVSDEARSELKTWDPFYHVGLIAPRPLLLLNVTKDQLVPRFLGESLQKAAGEGSEKMWVETDHFFTGIDRYALLEKVIGWMEGKMAVDKAATSPN